MKLLKKKVKLLPLVFKLSVVAIIFYFVFMLFNQQLQINDKKRKLEQLTEKLQSQEMANSKLRDFEGADGEPNKDYIKRVARENLDLSQKGERVFINVSGN